MVHALHEIWRVLGQDGYLIDLRPFGESRPIEVITSDEEIHVGVVDSSLAFPDDLAANRAIDEVVTVGLFTPKQSDSFIFDEFWESVDELRTYIAQKALSKILPETFEKAEQVMAQYGATARLRTRRHMIIACYQKIDGKSAK